MNAGIYDTEHFETTYALIRLLDNGKNKITIFIVADLAPVLKKMLGNEGIEYEWHLLQKNQFINSFIIYRFCKKNKIETLFLNTVTQYHFLFGLISIFLRNTKTILTIHDANSLFKPKLKFGLHSFLRYAGKKFLVQKTTHFATLLSSTKLYIQKTFKPKQNIICIPGSFFETKNYDPQPRNSFLKIVVPGSVDFKRRNYQFILQLLPKLNIGNIEIVLLGGVTEKNNILLAQFKSFDSDLIKIRTYDQSFIEVEEYERQLTTCDFILAPIQKLFHGESSVPEEYGLTKSSGSFFDAVRFGKPLIISSDLCIPGEIEKQCIRYHSIEELVDFFKHLNFENRLRYNQISLENSMNFTLENIRKRLPVFFNNN